MYVLLCIQSPILLQTTSGFLRSTLHTKSNGAHGCSLDHSLRHFVSTTWTLHCCQNYPACSLLSSFPRNMDGGAVQGLVVLFMERTSCVFHLSGGRLTAFYHPHHPITLAFCHCAPGPFLSGGRALTGWRRRKGIASTTSLEGKKLLNTNIVIPPAC